MSESEQHDESHVVRSLCIERLRDDSDKETIYRVSLSSESPIRDWPWAPPNVLVHEKSAIDLDGVTSRGLPFFVNHEHRSLESMVGRITNVRLDGKRLVGEIKFSQANPEAAMVRGMVDEGTLTDISITAEPLKMQRMEGADGKAESVRWLKWRPVEASVVSIGADRSVGIGRSEKQEPKQEPETREQPVSPDVSPTPAQVARGISMSEQDTAAAGASAEKISAVQSERLRREAIISLCKANRIDQRTESNWITDGVPLTDMADAAGKVTVRGVATQILEVLEERGKHKPAAAAELGLSSNEAGKYSLFRAIRALKFGGPRHLEAAGFEMECSQALAKKLNRADTTSILVPAEVLTRSLPIEVMQRAMATTPGAKGGYIVNVENMGFIDILRNRSVLRSLGARTLSGLEGNVVFGRQTGKPSVTWQGGEGTSVTAADQTLGQLSMTPKTAIVITDVSEQLLRQSNPSAEAFVMADLAADIAIDGVDAAGINGTGGAQPLGVKNTTGITSGQDAATFSYAKALAFPAAAGAVNAIRGNPGWVTNIAGAAVAMQKQRFSSTDTPLWEGNLLDGTLVGFRAMSSEQLASGNLIFGSWDELVIGEWGVLELATDNGGTRFNQAQVGIRAMWMVDILLRYPQAFVVSTNLAA